MNEIIQGDCLEKLKEIDDESIQCCVTSPPYWGLRDYGTASWEGGDAGCDHQYQKGGRNPETAGKQLTNAGTIFSQYEHTCPKCGANRVDDQLGLEETPELYVEKMVKVFREVRRVLKPDGTLWLNLGDSYNGSGKGGDSEKMYAKRHTQFGEICDIRKHGVPTRIKSLKPKDLCGIPWRVAFALQQDGWWLRQDIIWHKPNPMPESVQDRCTKSHEYIFLMTKSARYYYDHEAIKEPSLDPTDNRAAREKKYETGEKHISRLNPNTAKTYSMANKRSVWTVPTKPFKGAHFAVFPPELIKPCILAGSKEKDIVLDPFAGSGTALIVAKKYGRQYIGIELNPDYIEMAEKRLKKANSMYDSQ